MGLFKFGLKQETVDLLTTLLVEKLALVIDDVLRNKEINITIKVKDKNDGVIRK